MSLPLTQVTNQPTLAANWVKQGQLLAYPTESVWGIGGDPFNKAVIERLLAIKQRPKDKGMIVITDNVKRLSPFLNLLTDRQQHNVLTSWEKNQQDHKKDVDERKTHALMQATTWLVPIPDKLKHPIPQLITGKHPLLAVRVIAHPLIKQLCRALVSETNPYGFLVSTSCNPSGRLSATNLIQAQMYFKGSITYLTGETLGYQLPSQIKNALTGEVMR